MSECSEDVTVRDLDVIENQQRIRGRWNGAQHGWSIDREEVIVEQINLIRVR